MGIFPAHRHYLVLLVELRVQKALYQSAQIELLSFELYCKMGPFRFFFAINLASFYHLITFALPTTH